MLRLQFPKGLNNLDYNFVIHQSRNIINPSNENLQKYSKNIPRNLGEQEIEAEAAFAIGDETPYDNGVPDNEQLWTVEEIDEDNNRIALGRDTGNIIMPQEHIDTFLSELVDYVRSRTGEKTEEQPEVDGNEDSQEVNITEETVDFYSSEENYLPYDVEIRTLHFDEPEPKFPLKACLK